MNALPYIIAVLAFFLICVLPFWLGWRKRRFEAETQRQVNEAMTTAPPPEPPRQLQKPSVPWPQTAREFFMLTEGAYGRYLQTHGVPPEYLILSGAVVEAFRNAISATAKDGDEYKGMMLLFYEADGHPDKFEVGSHKVCGMCSQRDCAELTIFKARKVPVQLCPACARKLAIPQDSGPTGKILFKFDKDNTLSTPLDFGGGRRLITREYPDPGFAPEKDNNIGINGDDDEPLVRL